MGLELWGMMPTAEHKHPLKINGFVLPFHSMLRFLQKPFIYFLRKFQEIIVISSVWMEAHFFVPKHLNFDGEDAYFSSEFNDCCTPNVSCSLYHVS